jgi:hypothetical protein
VRWRCWRADPLACASPGCIACVLRTVCSPRFVHTAVLAGALDLNRFCSESRTSKAHHPRLPYFVLPPALCPAITRTQRGGSLRLVQPQQSAGIAGRLIDACKSLTRKYLSSAIFAPSVRLSPNKQPRAQEPTARALWSAGTAVASLELALSGAAVTALGGFRKSFLRKRQSRAVAVALQPIALGWVSGPHWWARSPGPLKNLPG